MISSVEPAGVAELISYAPPDLDLLLRSWLRIDPEMRCPGNPRGMAERVWLELTAVVKRVHAVGEADYPVGPRVTQEPDFAGLRAWDLGDPATVPSVAAASAGLTYPGSRGQ